ncbi:hypothetical protein [Luteimonas sp. e5]
MDALDGRYGHVGGIEQIRVDGTTHYFGFDYGSDLVLSPLTADLEQITTFASRHMEQMDGSHDTEYWAEIAQYGSELCSEEAERSFDLQLLAQQMRKLKTALANGTPTIDFEIPYHLQYLLASSGGWVAGDLEEVELKIDAMNGNAGDDVDRERTAGELIAFFSNLVRKARGNWRTMFSVLDIADPR